MRHGTTIAWAAAAWSGLAAAQGGGPSLYEVGTPDMGLSAAGAPARAEDAGTAYTNPAGMTRLNGDAWLVGLYGLVVRQDLELRGPGTVSQPAGSLDGGGSSSTGLPGGGLYGVTRRGDWHLGLAVNTPFAGGAKYEPQWVGRSFVIESQLLGLNIEPSLARRVGRGLSLGLGLNLLWATLTSERAIDNTPGARTVTLDASDLGMGLTLGALLELESHTRVGLTYRSSIDLRLEGEVDLPGEPTASLGFTLPQGVSLALRTQLTPGLALLSDLGWTDWSAFGRQRSSVGGVGTTLDRKWRDTWRVGLGVDGDLGGGTRLRAGLGYDSSAIRDEDLLPDIPFQDSLRYSLGLETPLGGRWRLGLSYTYMDRGNPRAARVALPPAGSVVLDGEFRESVRHFFGLSLGWGG